MSTQWKDLLVTDHTVIEKVLAAVIKRLESPVQPTDEWMTDVLDFVTTYVHSCHNQKEEQHLFPLLEARGVPRHGGPLAVMLAEHDETGRLLDLIKTHGAAFMGGNDDALEDFKKVFGDFTKMLGDHYWKENDILYPIGIRAFTPEDGQAVVDGIEAVEASIGPDTRATYYALADKLTSTLDDLSANINPVMLAAMLNTLPMEISLVDADDRVVYFSHEDHDKIFPRNRSAIGMAVQDCHPKKSVHLVNQVLADFKAGKRDVAEFWIDVPDAKIHIRYFPVLNKAGAYIGCLEVVQDIAPIQALKGQRRLLAEES